MRVVFCVEALASVTTAPWRLHQLLAMACEGQHRLLFDSPETEEACLATLEERVRRSYQHALAQGRLQAIKAPRDAVTLFIRNVEADMLSGTTATVNLASALVILTERLAFFLEDNKNDWCFFRGIMRGVMTAEEYRILADAVCKGWAHAVHGGGVSKLKETIETRCSETAFRLRTFIIFDSDRLHPREVSWTRESPDRHKAANQTLELQALMFRHFEQSHWTLQRRYIESYMPRSELESWERSEEKNRGTSSPAIRIDAFFRMNREQRWYFNMKRGFFQDLLEKKKDGVTEGRFDKGRIGNLYDDVKHERPADWQALLHGFDDKLGHWYQRLEDPGCSFDWDPEAREEAALVKGRVLRML